MTEMSARLRVWLDGLGIGVRTQDKKKLKRIKTKTGNQIDLAQGNEFASGNELEFDIQIVIVRLH